MKSFFFFLMMINQVFQGASIKIYASGWAGIRLRYFPCRAERVHARRIIHHSLSPVSLSWHIVFIFSWFVYLTNRHFPSMSSRLQSASLGGGAAGVSYNKASTTCEINKLYFGHTWTCGPPRWHLSRRSVGSKCSVTSDGESSDEFLDLLEPFIAKQNEPKMAD